MIAGRRPPSSSTEAQSGVALQMKRAEPMGGGIVGGVVGWGEGGGYWADECNYLSLSLFLPLFFCSLWSINACLIKRTIPSWKSLWIIKLSGSWITIHTVLRGDAVLCHLSAAADGAAAALRKQTAQHFTAGAWFVLCCCSCCRFSC